MEELKKLTVEPKQKKKLHLLPAKSKQDDKGERGVALSFSKLRTRLLGEKKEGFAPFPWKSLSVRNLLIAGCAVLILLAAYLNLRFAQTQTEEPPLVSTPGNAESAQGDDYFAVAVINRSRVRDEAIDMYQALADDEAASTTSREEAYASMNALVDRTAAEVDIENRVKAKGFENCVAVLEGDRASIIVQTDGLTDAEVAQITEIVYLEAGVIPQNLTITEKV
ncbi:MAG: SpoIIIAH-like family protein [Clostridia bacterium]|nr:SpoIIIAH-like family protein [Clostridia bacterium]